MAVKLKVGDVITHPDLTVESFALGGKLVVCTYSDSTGGTRRGVFDRSYFKGIVEQKKKRSTARKKKKSAATMPKTTSKKKKKPLPPRSKAK